MTAQSACVSSDAPILIQPSPEAPILRVPASVAAYLRANPSYVTSGRVHCDIAQAYFLERVWAKDWLVLRGHLPKKIESILDIGGGIGGFALLAHHDRGKPKITLVEQRQRSLHGRSFGVLELAGELLEANDVPHEAISLIAATDEAPESSENETYDLVVSLRALAFLFPYERYRPMLRKVLRAGGMMILDIKKSGSEFEHSFDESVRGRFAASNPHHSEVTRQLEEDFGSVTVLHDYENSMRVLVRRDQIAD